jgi:hypothetical protein
MACGKSFKYKEVETARGNMVKKVTLDDVKEDANISDICG